MDIENADFDKYLTKINKLEKIIKNNIEYVNFNTIINEKYNMLLPGADTEYNKLLRNKVLENLTNEKILNLID